MSRTQADLYGDMPDALKQKPATDPEVVAYFKRKTQDAAEAWAASEVKKVSDQYDARLADITRTPTPEKKPPSQADFITDPAGSMAKVAPTREEFDAMNAMAIKNAIQSAELIARGKFPDWNRFEKDINTAMAALSPVQRADSSNWISMYYALKGMQADTLVREAEEKVKKQSSEPTTAPNIPPPPKAALDADQKIIIDKLGITEDKYREKQQEVSLWPAKQ